MAQNEFVSELIAPAGLTYDAARIAAGEPGLPRQFRWREQTITVARLVRSWRQTGDCRHGSGEQYVRRHWYEVVTESGDTMKLYFERDPRKANWWLYSVRRSTAPLANTP